MDGIYLPPFITINQIQVNFKYIYHTWILCEVFTSRLSSSSPSGRFHPIIAHCPNKLPAPGPTLAPVVSPQVQMLVERQGHSTLRGLMGTSHRWSSGRNKNSINILIQHCVIIHGQWISLDRFLSTLAETMFYGKEG